MTCKGSSGWALWVAPLAALLSLRGKASVESGGWVGERLGGDSESQRQAPVSRGFSCPPPHCPARHSNSELWRRWRRESGGPRWAESGARFSGMELAVADRSKSCPKVPTSRVSETPLASCSLGTAVVLPTKRPSAFAEDSNPFHLLLCKGAMVQEKIAMCNTFYFVVWSEVKLSLVL